MPSTVTTQILIDRVQHGDRSALNDLCARYQQRVLRSVRIRLGAKLRGKIESWDIVQEVLMGAFGKLNSGDFRTEGALMKYLNVLVEHRIRDEADRQGAERRNADREIPLDARSPDGGDPLIEIAAPAAPGPSSLLVFAENLERLERAMDRLSADQRDLLVAVKLEGRTYGEMADEGKYGKTPDAIRMRAKRAEARLAQLYHELEGGP